METFTEQLAVFMKLLQILHTLSRYTTDTLIYHLILMLFNNVSLLQDRVEGETLQILGLKDEARDVTRLRFTIKLR